jgi:fumarylpyruvate hydrolase
MPYVFPPPVLPSLPVSGTDQRFPVRRIFCVGRNYAEHAREMGNDEREPPFFFTKPGDAVVESGTVIPYPPATADLHHEAELVAAIGKGGADIAPADALDHVWGYATGNDLTRRDLQAEAKAARRPWDMSKGFDASAVVGPLRQAADIGHPERGAITCTVNGTVRQSGDIADMIWPLPDVIAHLSRLVTLASGDLIFTGTPAGVGALVAGDTCEVRIDGLAPATVTLL